MRLRGGVVSLVFQEPMTALDPVYTVGEQIVETLVQHRGLGARAAGQRARVLLDLVQVPSPERCLASYPHEISGGMRQRAMIAIALAGEPARPADEPTTALDVTVQAQILWLLRDLQQRLGLAVIFVTHDLGVAAEIADEAAADAAGRIVEQAPIRELFRRPAHPYTEGLMQATVRRGQKGRPLVPIAGAPPNLALLPPGCAFAPRCPIARDVCLATAPVFQPVTPGHVARCHLVAERLAEAREAQATVGSRTTQEDRHETRRHSAPRPRAVAVPHRCRARARHAAHRDDGERHSVHRRPDRQRLRGLPGLSATRSTSP